MRKNLQIVFSLKCATSLLIFLALLLALQSTAAERRQHALRRTRGKHRELENSRLKERQQYNTSAGFETEENLGTSRLFVTYKNLQGKENAINVALAVHQEFKNSSLIVVDVDRDGANALRLDVNIESMEKDNVWEEMGYLDRYVDADEARRLMNYKTTYAENIPYGIVQAQGDQLVAGPHSAKVCLVDTGADAGHPDLDRNRMTGMDRKSRDKDILKWSYDFRGHGTHVAGTVGATCGNDKGVCGMGRGTVETVITRGLNNQGRAFESDVIEAIEQCVTAGAKVISLSLGGPKMSNQMHKLFDTLHDDHGIVTFAAAGNIGQFVAFYPAAHAKVISVTANDANTKVWKNSNFGPWIELSAAGVKVLSTTVRNGKEYVYAEYSGTSMATPHCAAAAGLLMSHFPECSNNQIRYALAYTAWDTKKDGCDDTLGYGIIQVKDAYNFLSKYKCRDANWGQKVTTDSRCSTIDEEPSRTQTFRVIG